MRTKRQEELIHSFLSTLADDLRPLYQEIIMYLSELGYYPQKERSNLSFKHDLHNKQIAKMGIKRNNEHSPFFALRFSACRDYSQRFTDIVREAIIKYPSRVPRCTENGCSFCGGEPDTHVYSCTFPDGETKSHCGAYALEIPNITTEDIKEIERLLCEEHEYLLKHEAGMVKM